MIPTPKIPPSIMKAKPNLLIYLIRHGSTPLNEAGAFRGMSQVSLSEQGEKEAKSLSTFMKKFPLDFLFTSPLPRAKETASIILENQSIDKFEIDERLKSVNYGEWEGQKQSDLQIKFPEQMIQYRKSIETLTFPGGESLVDVQTRLLDFLDEISQKFDQKSIGIVTHQICTRVLLSSILANDLSMYWKLGQNPCCVNIIKCFKDQYVVDLMNYTPYKMN
ncbi:adenosylcobalamin/alpha-ribazole phosphatase [Anaeramoeba ignava]|uniref:Adenosylcobalamin/alpha-ribazole phosphatase n=1 Tax=Anaeramoeba ignava TaxID=1746090 RepID=A0A9Q0LSP2_ANAIG|nr:adenosylcobalamin/alpha-ribazole phosphatase [Anaeramoeba ignava]